MTALPGPDFFYGDGPENCTLAVMASDGKTPLYMEPYFEFVQGTGSASQELHVNILAQAEALRTGAKLPHQYKRYQIR